MNFLSRLNISYQVRILEIKEMKRKNKGEKTQTLNDSISAAFLTVIDKI